MLSVATCNGNLSTLDTNLRGLIEDLCHSIDFGWDLIHRDDGGMAGWTFRYNLTDQALKFRTLRAFTITSRY